MKNGTADELLEAIDTVLGGELYVSPRVALLAVHKLVDRPVKGVGQVGLLSDRELQVFALIGASHGVGRIAQELNISRKTVETHCEHIKVSSVMPTPNLLRAAHGVSRLTEQLGGESIPDMSIRDQVRKIEGQSPI